jgi:hypothetical protein
MIPFNDCGEMLRWALEQFPGSGDDTKPKDGVTEVVSAFGCLCVSHDGSRIKKWSWYVWPSPKTGNLLWCGDEVESAF